VLYGVNGFPGPISLRRFASRPQTVSVPLRRLYTKKHGIGYIPISRLMPVNDETSHPVQMGYWCRLGRLSFIVFELGFGGACKFAP
jgi:hypothetical protein